MRLLHLDLARYGVFTDQALRFREGARLHVLYGRNEAGKSTALSAITDLLFGFQHRTAFNFLHARSDLRIGGHIRTRSGEELAFRRRYGKANTLLDANEKPLDENALSPFLQGLTREVFVRAFGLSTATLREGAHEMLRVEGEIGATLFAAASGLRRPGDLRLALNANADAIFYPGAKSKPLFYQLRSKVEDARHSIAKRELGVRVWKELNDHIDALRRELARIDQRRGEIVGELTKLQRQKRIAPLFRSLDEASAKLDESGYLPVLSLEFAQKLRDDFEAESDAAQRHRECVVSVEALLAERNRLSVDEALVARAGEVGLLFAGTSQYAKAMEDLPRVDRDAEAMRMGLETLARRLGLAQASEIKTRHPSDAELASLRALCHEGRALESKRSSLGDDLARERRNLDLLEQEDAAKGPAVVDPEPLRERLDAIAPVLRRLEQRAELEPAIEADAKSLAEAGRRLSPPVSSLDTLAEVPLPSPETIARFRKEHEILVKSSERAREEAHAVDSECRRIEADLKKLESAGLVPSLEAIAAARAERQTLWERLRGVLFGAELLASARDSSIASFERQVARADQLADEALADAQRVARHGLLSRQLLKSGERRAETNRALTQAELGEREARERWRAAWAASGVSPMPPGEMADWAHKLAALLDRRAELLMRRERLLALVAEDRALAPQLRALAQAMGLFNADEAGSVEVARRIETRIRKLAESWEATRQHKARSDAARERIVAIDGLMKEAASRFGEWKERWRAALPKVELPPDESLDAAEAALDAWVEVPDALERLARETARIDGMRRDNLKFETRARDLLSALAPDIVGLPFDIVAKTLHDRAQAATMIASRREDCAQRLAIATQKENNAKAALKDTRSALASRAAKAGLGEEENLPALLARLEMRSALEKAVSDKRDELLRAADGLGEEAIRAELSGFEPDTVAQRSVELEQERTRLDNESKEAFAALDREERRRKELETGVGAEVAAQMRRNAESELRAAAREWAVLKLGALLLGTAIERHREASQNPLLGRAGDLFRALTGGVFAGLATINDDEDDRPILVGKRAGGESVKIDGLSEGTRDQLYLALRLAYVESYAAKLDPPPFIADDIFVTFDDERTGHGIEALADIGKQVQCLLFTHHRRTVEIAVERLGESVDIIELPARG